STCAILAVADLCPTLTTHSLKTAESTNVSRQNKPITFGRALVNALIAEFRKRTLLWPGRTEDVGAKLGSSWTDRCQPALR
ncbi:MAG TPA: hypothetical protein VFR21_20315, partial [Bradyrhizobium sp.]|nr:hypothetical protein [Bradyrhizobium sp.]